MIVELMTEDLGELLVNTDHIVTVESVEHKTADRIVYMVTMINGRTFEITDCSFGAISYFSQTTVLEPRTIGRQIAEKLKQVTKGQ